ncbi:S8 family peptidase [Streptomyces goshikiensis]|uniref:S8 family peptidase n=1 Tax=Streptomyces goshikiensis TaxID=1942 RepID=UPI00368C087E
MCSIGGAWAGAQSNAPWGLARVSQRGPVGTAPWTYKFADNAGEGVNVFVLDTGIDIAHPDFEGRAVWSRNFTGDGIDRDCNGRGTHLAGTVGGKTYGVAKKVNVIAVKVAGCAGTATATDLIEGINFVVAYAKGPKGNVILIGSAHVHNAALNQAVASAYTKGLVVVVPAGNLGLDACSYSPAGAPSAVTVAAMTQRDRRLLLSNQGRCVDVLGPGENIVSAGPGATTGTRSGTAMAAAHGAGIAATVLSQGTPANQVEAKIKSLATKNAVAGFNSATPNALLFNGISA